MADEQKTNYKALIVTGLISLAVAVGGNMLVNRLSEEKLLLAYDLTASETFDSSSGNIRIATVSVSNDGSKSIDDISLTIDLPNGEITEHKVTGLPTNSYAIDKTDSKLALTTKYLNPTEDFSIQLLLSNPQNTDFLPFVDLRGRGTLGAQVVKEEKNSLLEIFGTAAAALSVAMLLLSSRFSRTRIIKAGEFERKIRELEEERDKLGDKHGAEQRDVVAYVLSIMSLTKDAEEVRYIPRDISYWSICDHLTQKWIDTDEKSICLSGAKALERLVDYASIHDQSILLIKSNIARLYKYAGEEEKSHSLVEEVLGSESGVIRFRVSEFTNADDA